MRPLTAPPLEERAGHCAQLTVLIRNPTPLSSAFNSKQAPSSPPPPTPPPLHYLKPPHHPPMPAPTYRVLSVLSIGGNLGAGSTACAAVGTPTPRASASTAAAAAERSAAPRDGGAAAIDGRVAAGAAAGRRPPPRVSRGAAIKAMGTAGEGGRKAQKREEGG